MHTAYLRPSGIHELLKTFPCTPSSAISLSKDVFANHRKILRVAFAVKCHLIGFNLINGIVLFCYKIFNTESSNFDSIYFEFI